MHIHTHTHTDLWRAILNEEAIILLIGAHQDGSLVTLLNYE